MLEGQSGRWTMLTRGAMLVAAGSVVVMSVCLLSVSWQGAGEALRERVAPEVRPRQMGDQIGLEVAAGPHVLAHDALGAAGEAILTGRAGAQKEHLAADVGRVDLAGEAGARDQVDAMLGGAVDRRVVDLADLGCHSVCLRSGPGSNRAGDVGALRSRHLHYIIFS